MSYRKFSQHVRKFEPDRVLEKIAQVSSELERGRWGKGAVRIAVRDPNAGPFRAPGLAIIARVAIVDGANRRKRRPAGAITESEMLELYLHSRSLDHPDLPEVVALEGPAFMRGMVLTDVDLKSPSFRRMMARNDYQQGLFGYSTFANITRTLGLLVDHHPDVRGLPTQQQWESALGASLPVYAAVVFRIAIMANVDDGWLTAEAIETAARGGAFPGIDTDTVREIIRTQLSADVRTLREVGKRLEIVDAQAWSFNPLMDTPLVSYGEKYLVPIHDYLIQKMTPLGLYFTGLKYFGDDFPRALGDSFEKYVGQLLGLIESAGAMVYPAITHGAKQKKETVDYIVVFDELVLLVEVKGLRANALAKAGVDVGLQQLVDKVQGARNQIDNTAQLLAHQIPELAHIPADREIRGLVVTLEPAHHIDTYIYQDMFETNTIESATVSANELEDISAALAEQTAVGSRILKALTFNDSTPPALGRAVEGLEPASNPVLDKLWNRWQTLLGLAQPERN